MQIQGYDSKALLTRAKGEAFADTFLGLLLLHAFTRFQRRRSMANWRSAASSSKMLFGILGVPPFAFGKERFALTDGELEPA